MPDYRRDIWRSNVSTLIGSLFIGVFALAAGLIIWHAAFDTNPVESILLSTISKPI